MECSHYGEVWFIPKYGKGSDFDVARQALDEIYNMETTTYHLFFQSLSSQVTNTLAATALFISGDWLITRKNNISQASCC